jgi:putative transposase
VFERFSPDRLDAFFRLFPVSSKGQNYISRALEAPSRNVAGTTHNLISNIPNPKMGMSTQGESKDGERPHVLKYTFDKQCLGFTTQPPPIEIYYKGRNGRTIRTQYTPDCLLFDLERGVVVEEWKPWQDRERLEELYPGKFCSRPDGTYGSECIEAVLHPMGIKFALRFSDEISSISHRNRQLLYTYLQPEAERRYLPQFQQLKSQFHATSQRAFGDLIEQGEDRDVLHWALAVGRLHFDSDLVCLADQAAIAQVFNDEATFKAWRIAIRPDGARPVCQVAVIDEQLRPGDSFLLDGRRLTAHYIGNTSVMARAEDGTSVVLQNQDMHAAVQAGTLVFPQKLTQAAKVSRFFTASSAALSRAVRSAEILGKIDKKLPLLAEEECSPATVRRWRKKVQEGLALGLSPVEALIDEIDQRGYSGPHIDRELSIELDKEIVHGLSDPMNKSKLTIYGDIEKKWKAAGKKMVALSCFYERAKKLSSPATVRASQGHKAAHQIEPAHWILNHHTPVHGDHTLEFVHLDSTLLDVEVRSSLSGAILGRPWLTLAVCAYSRRVMGFHLSFRPPSYVSSMATLADVIRRSGRLPQTVVHDWGSEFKAKDFKECLAALFIERWVRPKSAPRFGAVIERMFGTTTQQLIANIAGNTKARKQVRMLSPGSNPSRHSGLWLLDVYLGLEEFFFDIYNPRKHPATLLPPDAMFDSSLISHGFRPHRLRRLEDILPVICPYARGSTRMLDSARGLYVNYRHYSNPILADRALHKQDFQVKPNPFDPGQILTFVKGQWVTCRSPLASHIEIAPAVVKRCIHEEWSIEQQLVDKDSKEAREKLINLIEKLNARALENKAYWAEEEFRSLLKTAVFPSDETTSIQPANVEKLTESMEHAVRAALASSGLGQLVAHTR